MDAVTLLAAHAPETVLVIGSPPPAGKDLDLLVRQGAASVMADLLGDHHFHHDNERTWARFSDCGAEVVELIAADSLKLDEGQIDRLFAEAQSIDDLGPLMLPAPHHRLLLAARRAATEARLRPKLREMVRDVGEQAWKTAGELAPAWKAGKELSELRGALDGAPPRSWRLRSPWVRASWHRGGSLIAFSGLDGSGKSTQVESLVGSLSALGYPTIAIWSSIAANRSLDRIAAPARLLLGPSKEVPGRNAPPAGEDEDRLTRLRERLPWLNTIWVNLLVAMNAWWYLREVWPNILRGRVVVCDRYILDSAVQLRYRYGAERSYGLQLRFLRWVSPKPLRAYLLDVAPAVVYVRNQEYTPAQIELRAGLYGEEHAQLGVRRIDGERAQEDICSEIAVDAWKALTAERGRAGIRMRALRRILG